MTDQLPGEREGQPEDLDARRAGERAGSAEPRAAVEPAERRDDLLARLDKLQDAANAASGHARNVYVTFLLFGLYLAIIFGSTTHEQLLRESPVTLPLLGVGLPLFGFYWIAPALFVLLHLNLLLEFYLLSGKLHRLDRTLGEAVAQGHLDRERADDRRAQLYPFPFSQMLVGQHGRLIRFLLWLMVWLTVLVLPVMLLLMGQVRFLPYHDAWTTMWQRFLVAADLLLILIFWRAIRHPADRLLRHPSRWLWHQAKVALPALIGLVLSFVIFTFPGDYAANDDSAPSVDGDDAPAAEEDAAPSAEQEARDFGDPMEEALLDDDGWFAWAYPTRWRVARAPELGRPQAPPIFWPTQVLFESLPFLDRNLVVGEVHLVASWPTQTQIDQFGANLAWQNFGSPPDLRDRDLRYADLSRSILERGDFREANLRGAYLEWANLRGADLKEANLQGANLRFASLQGVALFKANLQEASLWAANLQRASLQEAKLQGANLAQARLQGAYLVGANLEGASLWHADLLGAMLLRADLRGANLDGAGLQVADLRFANLQGARLVDADLQGAHLDGANLQGADLRDAHLWRAGLDGDEDLGRWALADLRGVDVAPIEEPARIEQEIAEMIDQAGGRDWHLTGLRYGPAVPRFPKAWRLTPNVMFNPGDPLPKRLGWGKRV